jgi:hypothetical protein
MKMTGRIGAVLCWVVPVLGAAQAGEAAVPPKALVTLSAVGDGDQVKVQFAVSAPTDVEVAVVSADGGVVRHLVAGVLGGQDAPPPPLKPGLVQSIVWDGRDDGGKPAAGGPFRVRVRAGMKPALDGFLLENPASTGSIASLAIGPKGSVYVFHRDPTTVGHWGSTKIKILSREGRHERAVMPFPADLAADRLAATGVFQAETGDLVPRVHDLLRLNLYCNYQESFWRTPDQCPAVDSKGRVHWLVMGPAVASLDADGGVPYATLTGPALLPEVKGLTIANQYFLGHSRPCLALSSDEKFLYFAGLTTGRPDRKEEPITGVPCVFRVPVDTRGPAEVWLGTLDAPGKEGAALTAPRGVAVANGLVYVADHAAHRIAVFNEKDRSFAGEIKVAAPDSLGVDPATGAVYVCSLATETTPDLLKFENYRTGKELLRIPLPFYRYANERIPHRIAVDCSARPVRIWVPTIPYSKHQLLCIEDAGEKFVALNDPRPPDPWAEGPQDLSYDRLRGELYVKSNVQSWYRLEEKSGTVLSHFRLDPLGNPNAGTTVRTDAAGNLVTYSWSAPNGLRRYDRDGKPLNWPGLATNHIPLSGVMNYAQRGLVVAGPDELLIIPPADWRKGSSTGSEADEPATCLNVYGLDGKVKRTLIWQCLKGAIPKLDRQGNIYLAEMVKPLDRLFPAFFDGKIKPPPVQTGVNDDSFYYSYMYGSIVKFPPTGGAIWSKPHLTASVEGTPPAELLALPKVPVRIHAGYRTQDKADLQGALWHRFGFAPYTCVMSSCYRTCMCESAGFDVDPYGRVFFPNLGQFRIEVLDTSGNPLTMFGQYGNQDSRGAGSLVPKPAIPLTWPLTVAVSETHAYVADTLSRRVVKVKIAYAAEETCPVTVPVK